MHPRKLHSQASIGIGPQRSLKSILIKPKGGA